MLVWKFCLFILLVTRVEGKELNEKRKRFKTMGNAGRETSSNINQNNTEAAKLKLSPIGHHRHHLPLKLSSNITVVPRTMVAREMGSVVGAMAWQTLAQHVSGCHFALVTSNTQNPLVSHVIRYSAIAFQPLVVVDVNRIEQRTSEHLLMALWGDAPSTCRTLFIDLTNDDNITELLRFLDTFRLWVWSEVWVVLVGNRLKAQDALLHQALRNLLQPIYLGLEDITLRDLTTQSSILQENIRQNDQKLVETMTITRKKRAREVVTVFSRCLYCNAGEPRVRFLFLWPLGAKLSEHINPFPDQLDDLQSRQLHVVTIRYFPYSDYQLNTDEPATTVTLLDCVDKRFLETFSAHLNFTYEVRVPWDMQFGIPTKNGNWTGMVGTIQYNKADFCTYIAPSAGRLEIINVVRTYETDFYAIISLKPQVLPRYLVIIRPFTVDVWLYLVLITMVWGATLWILQRSWSHFTGKRGITLNTAIFYSWAVILEDPPPNLPTNITGQMLVGWWLVACLVITTGYKASLVTNLVKEGKTSPIDSLQDLVGRVNWKWQSENYMLTGYPFSYFQTTKDALVKYVYEHMEFVDGAEVGLKNVLSGGYSYFALVKLIKPEIASYYTNDVGETPFYVSKHGLDMYPDFVWGFRKGAPYHNRFNLLMMRLQEAGISEYWTKDVMSSRVKKNRKESQQKDSEQKTLVQQLPNDDDRVVLRMSHMMGVFLTLLLGLGVAFFSFLAERIMLKWNN